MHEQGYQYIGDTRFGKLTQPEMDILQLGFIVREEAKEDAYDDAKRGGNSGGHSKSRADTRRKLRQRQRARN